MYPFLCRPLQNMPMDIFIRRSQSHPSTRDADGFRARLGDDESWRLIDMPTQTSEGAIYCKISRFRAFVHFSGCCSASELSGISWILQILGLNTCHDCRSVFVPRGHQRGGPLIVASISDGSQSQRQRAAAGLAQPQGKLDIHILTTIKRQTVHQEAAKCLIAAAASIAYNKPAA